MRTEQVGFADGHARITRRLRQVSGLDCQSMPTSHAAVRHGVSWSKARRAEKAFLTDWDRTRPRRRRGIRAPMKSTVGNGRNSTQCSPIWYTVK
ncbi:MAG: hypothetical protein DMF89_21975 [Acidobacteria bacterium]|nr:MAG: hypothetical protein DMF89_21975 [Acidobacteriota bacterium]